MSELLGKDRFMMKTKLVRAGGVSVALFAVACVGCAAGMESESTAIDQAAATTDPIPCAAWADTVAANTSNVSLGARTLVDSYQSSVGAYGGTNVGSAAVVQAGTTITNNGGVVRGTLKANAPGGFATIAVPAGAKNLPLGASTPGSLSINTAAQSVTLAPGNYVVTNLNVSGTGALKISPAGQVRIWVTGGLTLGGNSNAGGVPKNLAFLVTGSGFVNVNAGGATNALVYAPNSGVTVGGPVFGSVIGKSVTLNSGGAVHFDQSSVCGAKSAVLDQSFTTPADLSAGLYGKPVFEAQSYTAGVSGTLQGVALDVLAIDTTQSARIQIEAITNGVPSNVVLGTARAPKGDLALGTVIPFTTSIPQVAGQQYAILVDYPDAPPFVNGIQNTASWNGSDGNAYAAGTMFATFDNGTTWTSYQSQGFDLHFQTYVVPN
jgi:hypothetical protein